LNAYRDAIRKTSGSVGGEKSESALEKREGMGYERSADV